MKKYTNKLEGDQVDYLTRLNTVESRLGHIHKTLVHKEPEQDEVLMTRNNQLIKRVCQGEFTTISLQASRAVFEKKKATIVER